MRLGAYRNGGETRADPQQPDAADREGDDAADREGDDAEPRITEFMRVGGGPGRRALLAQFLSVVQRIHAGAGAVEVVAVTDSYILRDRGEAGVGGGFANLCAYLGALGLTQDSPFRFVMPPSPRGNDGREAWVRNFTARYGRSTVGQFNPQLAFHDRFYVVRHQGGQVKGVFGPSLNGLGATDIALMGEIEVTGALAVLRDWLV